MSQSYLSFHLNDAFLEEYVDRVPEWGFPIGGGNTLGELTYLVKYARRKDDGTKERWHEACQRVIEGMYSILKDHCTENRTPWNERKAQKSAQDAYERMFSFKWLPPGRGIWMMGTEFVNERRNSASLQNCAYISTEKVSIHSKVEATLPFTRLMEMSMLGVGVGFDTKGAGKVTLAEPDPDVKEPYTIPDTREGWCESVGDLLWTYFHGGPTLVFDYALVRPAGEYIKGFGGVAAGPDPLIRLHDDIRRILDGRAGEPLSSTDIVDICNLIGKCVVSGNVRRSAEIALGDADDEAFLNLKNFELNPVRMGADGWGHSSNNSVFASVGDDYDGLVDRIVENGEPGLVYLDIARSHGRLADPENNKDHRVAGVNPCVTEDTWVSTTEGPRLVRDLVGRRFTAVVDGKPYETLSEGFWLTGTDRQVYDLVTEQGYVVRLTDNHQVMTEERGWVEAGDLIPGERVVLHNHEGASWGGRGSESEGYLLGHLWGDGTLVGNKAVLSVWGSQNIDVRAYIESIAASLPHRSDWKGFTEVPGRDEWRLNSTALAGLASTYGMVRGNKKITDEVEQASSEFYRGFLRAAFDTDGSVEGSLAKGVSIRLHQSDREQLERAQRMLARLGILSTIYSTRPGRMQEMPDGKGGSASYWSEASWRLVITNQNAAKYMTEIGFADPAKKSRWESIESGRVRARYTKPDVATFSELVPAGFADVFDVTVADVHAFDANGLYVHNCAEQTLESYECCTLVETFPVKHDTQADYMKTLKVAYLYGKAVTMLPTHWPEVNEVMQRNRRIGCSVSGSAQFVEQHGWAKLRTWLDDGYQEIKHRDQQYSEWLGVRESIKMTSVKPSGSVSLVAGVTPGVHWPTSDIYIRRMRLSVNDPLVEALREAGYHTEPDVMNPNFDAVVELPTLGPRVRTEQEVSVWEKAALAVLHQRYWADNAVSVTLTFSPHEKDQIGSVIRAFEGQLKTMSFLPTLEGGAYAQMPYEQIDVDTYDASTAKVKKLDWDRLYGGDSLDAVGEAYCSTDKCEIKLG